MKYVVIIGDGMADFPIEDRGGKTPLMIAHKPYMDLMARKGSCGKVITVPEGFSPGSDVACMSIFGYDPSKYYTGRAPIEAYGMDISMGEEDVAFRCNLVSLEKQNDSLVMADYSGGHISTEEARSIIEELNRDLGGEDTTFYPGVGYRHIMMWKGGSWQMSTTPPHDITGRAITPHLPSGEGADRILHLMEKSWTILAKHPVNQARESQKKRPANSIWLWGQGKSARLPLFREKHGLKGATVAAVDLVKGISKMVGFDTPYVKGATGYLDTDYRAKAMKAVELLEEYDVVYVHIEAPDEASHNGDLEEKIKAIESIDRDVLGYIYEATGDGVRFLIVTDHATPISMRTHFATPVPFVVYEKGKEMNGCSDGYDECAGTVMLTGEELVDFFVKG